MVVDDPGAARCRAGFALVLDLAAVHGETLALAAVMVEPEPAAGGIGDIRQDIVGPHCHFAILDVLGMHEEEVVDHSDFVQQRGAGKPVKVGSCNQTHVASGGGGPFYTDGGLRPALPDWGRGIAFLCLIFRFCFGL